MKSYTDIEQSKKLAEILPHESADMVYFGIHQGMDGKYYLSGTNTEEDVVPIYKKLCTKVFAKTTASDVINQLPCWSLAALLGVLPKKYYPIKDHETDLILGKPKDKWCALYWDTTGMQDGEQTLADNPVDACVAMIEKLHELKLL